MNDTVKADKLTAEANDLEDTITLDFTTKSAQVFGVGGGGGGACGRDGWGEG